jgi:16S rRNA processing protein RimM
MTSRKTAPPSIEDASKSSSTSPSGDAGSPQNGEPVFLAVGKLRRPHGLHGEIIMDVLTDFPERLQPGMTLFVGPDHQPRRLRSLRWHTAALLVAFEGMDTPEQAGEFRNQAAYVPAADRPRLPEGEYYHHQMIGLKVVSESGSALGKITEILDTGANDVYVVRAEMGPEILIPAVDDFVLAVDLERGEMRVRLAPGLLPD